MLGLDVALLTCLVLGPAADMGSTEVALARGLREGNILVRNRGVRITLSIGMTVAQYKLLRDKSKKTKIAGCAATLAHRGAVTYLNIKKIQEEKRRP